MALSGSQHERLIDGTAQAGSGQWRAMPDGIAAERERGDAGGEPMAQAR